MKYEKQINSIFKISNFILGKDKVKTIFEIGARDGSETKALNMFFPQTKIYSFECNPATVSIWREKIKDIDNIIPKELAVSNKKGVIDFYQIDQEKTETSWPDGNPGASSLLESSGKYEIEKYVQKKVSVATERLDNIMAENNISVIDLIWMDIQGAELMALKGLGERIKDVNIIHSEVEFFEIYKDQPLFMEIKRYLNKRGFLLGFFTSFGKYSGDAVFINKHTLKDNFLKYIYLLIKDKTLYPYLSFILKLKLFIKSLW